MNGFNVLTMQQNNTKRHIFHDILTPLVSLDFSGTSSPFLRSQETALVPPVKNDTEFSANYVSRFYGSVK